MARICSIQNCGKPHAARGWCSVHYNRWRTNGDPLSGGTSMGEAYRYYRDIVLTYNGDECLSWPYARDSGGYGRLRVAGKGQSVHRLICEEANGPPPSGEHEAAHSCGRGHEACVAKRHLFWKTPKENSSDKFVHGTVTRGEVNSSAKLTENDVRSIRSLRGVMPQSKIASLFGVGQSCVGKIHSGTNWGWLE